MLVLPSSLTLREARAALGALTQALQTEASAVVTVDASGLQRFDTAALAVLLECRRLAEAAGKGFAVQQAPPRLAELARLYGLGVLLAPATG